MDARIPARLIRSENRKFGLAVGAVFAALGAVTWWRHKHVVAAEFEETVGGMLLLFGIVAPSALAPVSKAWTALSHVLSKVTTPIFMAVVYFAVITPVGVIMRWCGRRTLVPRADNGSFWGRSTATGDAESMKRQF